MTLCYRPANYDRMKRFMKTNRRWFAAPWVQTCTEYVPINECTCHVCIERKCDELARCNPTECNELSLSLMEVMRMGCGLGTEG